MIKAKMKKKNLKETSHDDFDDWLFSEFEEEHGRFPTDEEMELMRWVDEKKLQAQMRKIQKSELDQEKSSSQGH